MKPLIALDVDGPLVFDNRRLQGFFEYMINIGVKCRYDIFSETGEWSLAVPSLDRPAISMTWASYIRARKVYDTPTPGAIEALISLNGTERIVATARTKSEEPATLKFLQHHYGRFRACYFELDCKVDVAEKADFFIDDNVGIANKVATQGKNGTTVILFPTPGQRQRIAHHKVITLQAEKEMTRDTPLEELPRICRMAWDEIITIIRSANALA